MFRSSSSASFWKLAVLFLSVGILLWFGRVPASFFFVRHFQENTIATLINPGDPTLLLEAGNSYFGHGKTYDVKKAQEYFLRATEIRADFPEAHYQLGRTYFIQGKFAKALSEIERTIEYAPDFKKAYYMHGLINGYKGDLDQAILGFEEFIKRDSFNWAGYNDLAWIHFKKGDFEKTRSVAEEGLRHAETNPWLLNIYGTALLNLGEKELAREAFQKASEESARMTPEDWGRAYPGNNPEIYARGLEETRSVIEHNLRLTE